LRDCAASNPARAYGVRSKIRDRHRDSRADDENAAADRSAFARNDVIDNGIGNIFSSQETFIRVVPRTGKKKGETRWENRNEEEARGACDSFECNRCTVQQVVQPLHVALLERCLEAGTQRYRRSIDQQ